MNGLAPVNNQSSTGMMQGKNGRSKGRIPDGDGMDLRQYDGQCVRITHTNGEVYDGICSYNSADYNEHEYGRNEDGLQILNLLFYRSDISEVESLEEHEGPYGKFLDGYGKVEEMAVEDGIDGIVDVLFCDEKEHVHRMLRCLDKYFDPNYGHEFPWRYETIGALHELLNVTKDEYVKVAAERLITIWGPK